MTLSVLFFNDSAISTPIAKLRPSISAKLKSDYQAKER